MGIMTGNEEAWLRMMLDDKAMLTQMGLPMNMTEAQKEEVIGAMMGNDGFMTQLAEQDEAVFNTLMTEHNNFEEPELGRNKGESPCDWMVREALSEMEDTIEIATEHLTPKLEIRGTDLQVDGFYQITFPNGNTAKVRLARIMKNSFGDDYIFENLGGAEKLVSKSAFSTTNEFPLPQQLLSATQFHTLG